MIYQNGTYLRDARPQVPIVNAGEPAIEDTNFEKALFAHDHRRGYEVQVQLQHFPEEVSALSAWHRQFAGWDAFLIGEHHTACDEACLWM